MRKQALGKLYKMASNGIKPPAWSISTITSQDDLKLSFWDKIKLLCGCHITLNSYHHCDAAVTRVDSVTAFHVWRGSQGKRA